MLFFVVFFIPKITFAQTTFLIQNNSGLIIEKVYFQENVFIENFQANFYCGYLFMFKNNSCKFIKQNNFLSKNINQISDLERISNYSKKDYKNLTYNLNPFVIEIFSFEVKNISTYVSFEKLENNIFAVNKNINNVKEIFLARTSLNYSENYNLNFNSKSLEINLNNWNDYSKLET